MAHFVSLIKKQIQNIQQIPLQQSLLNSLLIKHTVRINYTFFFKCDMGSQSLKIRVNHIFKVARTNLITVYNSTDAKQWMNSGSVSTKLWNLFPCIEGKCSLRIPSTMKIQTEYEANIHRGATWELEENEPRFQIKSCLFSELHIALSVEWPIKSSWLFEMICLGFLLVATESSLIGSE